MMNAHTLELLQFDEIRTQVAGLCLSEEGRELLEDQEVSSDLETIRERLDFAGDLRRRLEVEPLPGLQFPPVRAALEKFEKSGTVAEGVELAAIGLFLGSTMELRRVLLATGRREGRQELPPSPLLGAFAADLPDLSAESKRILHLLNDDGTVNEDHVPELKSIRRQIQHLHTEIAALTARYLGGEREIWQADVPTQRDGRTVLPLKANYRGRVAGIVHEVSATGATLFIEPMDVVEKNNEIVEQDNRYRREVHRVLRGLTELIRARIAEAEELVARLASFDALYARARYAALHGCTRAAHSERRLLLRRATHPLLGSAAVPIDFELGETASIMIITGANAGGKTVSLKTVGLLALMNQWGMEIPAADGSELPLFDDVLVDIGDDQSIANSLSTFSGHMKALSAIISRAGSSSLVLLDEIGSGTDPAEGSALAMAVLDDLLEKRSLVVATTHHGVIKRYGYSNPGIMNASVAFDTATLSPTYELVIGTPGESHALEIAGRSRIPQAILDRAKEYFEQQRTDLDRAADELAARRRELDAEQARLAERAQGIDARGEELAKQESDLEEERRRLRESEFGELKGFVLDSRRELENLVRELRTGEVTREKTRGVKAFIDKLDEKVADEEREARRPRRTRRAPEEALGRIEPGAEVFVGESRRRGTVLRKARGDRWLVAVNTLRLTLSAAELTPAPSRRPAAGEGVSLVVAQAPGGEAPQLELDLRGMRLEEALSALERQLDRAILAGIPEFSVIHGKGEGVLQQGVRRMLETARAVEEFHFSPPEAGGFGKTIVRLTR